MSSQRKIIWTGLFATAIIVLVTYWSALRLSFYGDDYSFVERAGRSSVADYLKFYFDPRVQTGWYRPMQGMLFGIEWMLFRGDPIGYHVVNVLVHLFNCLLFFAISWRVAGNLRIAFLAAFIYAGLPLYGVAVFWPGDADFLLTFFYLLAILSWVLFIQQRQPRFQILAFGFFLLALMTKEFGVTIPLVLYLVDRFLLRGSEDARTVFLRYLPFAAVYAIYLPTEQYIQSRSVLTNQFGYGVGAHVLKNFLDYLAALAFPWSLPEPVNYAWLVAVALVLVSTAFVRKTIGPLTVAAIGVLAFLPAIGFPWFLPRYLYGAVMVTAIFIAYLVDYLIRKFSARWIMPATSFAIALIVSANGLGTAQAAAEFAELARQTRVPLRDITQRHPTFPSDTLLYFVSPPSPTSQYSGMFFLRYGSAISVSSNESDGSFANLRAHENSYVIYFDEDRRTREIHVEKDLRLRVQPESPVRFGDSLQLERYELVNAQAKRGEAIGIILYFKSSDASGEPFLVSLDLVSGATGKLFSSREGELHVAGNPNALITFPQIIPIPSDAPTGGDYRLDLVLIDSRRQLLGNKLSFLPLSVVE